MRHEPASARAGKLCPARLLRGAIGARAEACARDCDSSGSKARGRDGGKGGARKAPIEKKPGIKQHKRAPKHTCRGEGGNATRIATIIAKMTKRSRARAT